MGAPPVARIGFEMSGTVHGQEWNSGFYASYAGDIPVDDEALTDYVAAVWALFTDAWIASWCIVNDPATFLTGFSAKLYEANSLAVAQQAQNTVATQTGSGAYGGAVSQAICSSLYTATPSRRARGRMYQPATAALAGASANSGFAVSATNTYGSQLADAFTAVNALDGPDGSGAVRVGVQSLLDSQIRPVTRVLLDTRPDRIEHREKRITFARSTHTVALS